MAANQKSTPVCMVELKALIYQKIGSHRAVDYFELLKSFLSLRLNKTEFDKYCTRIIGRDNIYLHNQLIRTILGSCYARNYPTLRTKNVAVAASPIAKVSSGLPVHSRFLANRERKFCDPSLLGPLGKNTELPSLGSRPPVEIVLGEDGNSLFCQKTRGLPDARSLMNILEQKLNMKGLNISVEGTNVLNNGLDCYLKKLIEPCIGLAGSRCMKERPQHITGQRVTALSGILPASGIFLPEPSHTIYATLSDFGAVMESNPRILGGNWNALREKIMLEHLKR
ncbi:hypothetical protein DCAR_0933463 [Daucus carota subsp. sativus]|uniref:Transcriptional coactivator Hfi1/Transcriptional adapter 1 n=1 Tax=Daucus carota subsp. sativus TaxID=79200 RepID=A0A175YDX9_DAUCS|nr:PREDICTED: uncharacterized protein LOC108200330 [Daucus carota subsp. sativus]WOH13950.1 hypothetical protein DCAR_0933463 [Daucus carota subsp. sativus]